MVVGGPPAETCVSTKFYFYARPFLSGFMGRSYERARLIVRTFCIFLRSRPETEKGRFDRTFVGVEKVHGKVVSFYGLYKLNSFLWKLRRSEKLNLLIIIEIR